MGASRREVTLHLPQSIINQVSQMDDDSDEDDRGDSSRDSRSVRGLALPGSPGATFRPETGASPTPDTVDATFAFLAKRYCRLSRRPL